MLLGNAAERSQRILQALGQCDEALAAEHNMGVLETRECQSEVIEPMRQRDAGNRDAERARVGEVRQAKTAGRVLLRGGNGSLVGLSVTHVQPHLVVGDVEAGQGLIPHL